MQASALERFGGSEADVDGVGSTRIAESFRSLFVIESKQRKVGLLTVITRVYNEVVVRLIFTYLVAASLPLGIFPTVDALEEFDLYEQFAPLVSALQVSLCIIHQWCLLT